ncbi:MAG TPA: urease accessory protein UreD [Chloroflexota bacterium]|nr:urease accessory protein UreD [Chloroflexota bacterium]
MSQFPSAPPASHGWLDLVLGPSGGKTVLTRQDGRSPLHVQSVLHGEGRVADVVLLNVAGMILGGDRQDLRVEVLAGGHARLRTVGATHLHRAEPAAPAQSRVTLHAGSDALLEYFPGVVIPHAGAWFQQDMMLNLAPGGHAVVAEIVSPGRLHSGEAFAYKCLALSLSAGCAGSPLVTDALMLEPGTWSFGRAALFGPYTHLATLYALGPRADATLADELHALVQRHGAHGGATPGHRDAVVLRALGHSAHSLAQLLHAVLACCRRHMLGRAGLGR